MQFQRRDLLQTSSSSSDSDDCTFDPARNKDSGNLLVKFATYAKFKKAIGQFADRELDYKELNLMRGMYQRRLKDFRELQRSEWEAGRRLVLGGNRHSFEGRRALATPTPGDPQNEKDKTMSAPKGGDILAMQPLPMYGAPPPFSGSTQQPSSL